ncbi:hypothetical protein DSO57_1013241 [Entomophthora muscae]|uniref:Uncharacterized protein n=1 Tax=Entomophthora muscae TaxID=34485 RepID=A0ACC2SIL6_9FUNG|nr:hypothetical protein DSO57_1013241 [Entomophthora muscae]
MLYRLLWKIISVNLLHPRKQSAHSRQLLKQILNNAEPDSKTEELPAQDVLPSAMEDHISEPSSPKEAEMPTLETPSAEEPIKTDPIDE